MRLLFLGALVSATFLVGCDRPQIITEDAPPSDAQKQTLNVSELTQAMTAFRASLSPDLLQKCANPVSSDRLYKWHNTPANNRGKRDGITYGDLSEDQLRAFKDILQLFLSTNGYQKVAEITEQSEGYLELLRSEAWNRNFYSIDLFGDPATEDSWGFQLDGHHCVLNFIVQGDNVSIVPAFLGAEPAAASFQGKDFDIFQRERDLAVTLYGAMSTEEKQKGVTQSTDRGLKVGPARRPSEPDPYLGNYDYSAYKTGLRFSDMSAEAQGHLITLMKEYVYNIRHQFADTWWQDIQKNLDDTYFTLTTDDAGSLSAKSQFYYRIYNPYLWVEFNVESITGPNRGTLEPWNHVHTITRIPNNPATQHGGDYGELARIINQAGPMTLQEHYLNHH